MNHEHVQVRAYYIWLNSGYVNDRDITNWLLAEKLEHEHHHHEHRKAEDTSIFDALHAAVEDRPDYDPNAKLEPATLAQSFRPIDKADLEKTRIVMERTTTEAPISESAVKTVQTPIHDKVAASTAFDNFDSNNRKDTATALTGTAHESKIPDTLAEAIRPNMVDFAFPQKEAPKKPWWKKILGL
jgi:hypothetical protein